MHKQISIIILICVFAIHCAINNKDQPNHNKCSLPKHPENGKWSVDDSETILHPGQQVPSNTTIRVQCNGQYKLDSPSLIQCVNGEWSSNIGQCLKFCPPINFTSATKVTCTRNGKTVDCLEAVDGTIATFQCAPYYEDVRIDRNPTRLCVDGTWDYPIPKCVPVCGEKSVQAEALRRRRTVTKSDYPWQVALYRLEKNNKQFICSGTLIAPTIILTTAHCVTTTLQGEILPKEKFIVAVGKYYRNFEDPRDVYAQSSTLKHIFVPRQYKGPLLNYIADIAVLVTENSFKISRKVQPVCIDWEEKYEEQFFSSTVTGFVSGWSLPNVDEKSFDELKDLEAPYINTHECRKNMPPDFEVYLTFDKICSGYLNESKSIICNVNSGAGLVFKNQNDRRYYLTGILGIAPLSPTGGCENQYYGLYTKISSYVSNFILDKLQHS